MQVHIIESRKQFSEQVTPHLKHVPEYIILDSEGRDLGKTGKLCLLQICFLSALDSKIHVFLIDPLLAGKEIISEDLKNILESEQVVKVIHDVRQDATALYHQFGVKLTNIFDTQIAHRVIRTSRVLRACGSHTEIDLRKRVAIIDLEDFDENFTIILQQVADPIMKNEYAMDAVTYLLIELAFQNPEQATLIALISEKLHVKIDLEYQNAFWRLLLRNARQRFNMMLDKKYVESGAMQFLGEAYRKKLLGTKVVVGILQKLLAKADTFHLDMYVTLLGVVGRRFPRFEEFLEQLNNKVSEMQNNSMWKQKISELRQLKPEENTVVKIETEWSTWNPYDYCTKDQEYSDFIMLKKYLHDISLVDMLEIYCNIDYSLKLTTREGKTKNSCLPDWSVRPISKQLIEFASKDVYYLNILLESLLKIISRKRVRRKKGILLKTDILLKSELYAHTFRDYTGEGTINVGTPSEIYCWNVKDVTVQKKGVSESYLLRVIDIKDDTMGRIIGAGYQNLQNLRLHCLDTLIFTPGRIGFPKDRIFIIGRKSSVEYATQLIPKIVVLLIPKDKIGRLLGKSGFSIHAIEDVTGVRLKLTNRFYNQDQYLIVYGTDHNRKQAIDLINYHLSTKLKPLKNTISASLNDKRIKPSNSESLLTK